MKPKMFGSGAAAPKFGAGKPSNKKAMPGSRRMNPGGPVAEEARGEAIDYMPPFGEPWELVFEPPPEDLPTSPRARPGGQFSSARRPAAPPAPASQHTPSSVVPEGPSYNPGGPGGLGARASNSDDPQIEATDYMRHYPGSLDGGPGGPGARGGGSKEPAPLVMNKTMASDAKLPRGEATGASVAAVMRKLRADDRAARPARSVARPAARPAARPRGPTAGELEADRLTDRYNRRDDAAPRGAMPQAETPSRRGSANEYDFGGSGKTGGSVARGKIVKKMASGGKVKKMAVGSLVTAPPMPSPNDEQNRFVPNARKKLLDAQKRQALLGMPEGIKHGGKVKKMAGGGPSGEMQAFMKGRRDARGSMAPRAAMMPKASMAPMAPKARMMSKAPMAPRASMLGMKSGGAARGKSRGNGCAAKGHTRGRMV